MNTASGAAPLRNANAATTAPGVLEPDAPETAAFRADVLAGLASPRPSIPCKYLYDRCGAELFDAISRLDAYYLTRVEWSILCAHLPDIARRLGPRCLVIEFGTGSGAKTELLLEQLEDPVGYVAFDIARDQLAAVSARLRERFPSLEVFPVCADYTRELEVPRPRRRERRRVVFFPGSTIGNFEPLDATRFLARARRLCGPGGALLIGVDRQKDRRTLELAYNDPDGVTAQFNLNLLHRMRRELGAELDPDGFAHRAIYDERAGRIEMHLVSRGDQTIRVPDPTGEAVTFRFAPGDVIVTEHSYKYTVPGFAAVVHAARFRVEEVWSDPEERFSVFLCTVPDTPNAL